MIRNGVNGMIFQSGNVDNLVSCMEKALDSHVIKALHQNIVDGFDASLYTLENHVCNLSQVYESL